MPKGNASPDNPAAAAQMGRDGWFTLLLSNLFIVLLGGLSLLWQARQVVRHARSATASCAAGLDGMLVLGVRLQHGEPGPDFRQRLRRAHYLQQQHGGQIMLLGGVTGGESLSEAAAGRAFLLKRGVDPASLQLEDRSRNTLENLRNAREQLRQGAVEHYALISNRYHLARCLALAHGLGMAPLPCAAEEQFSAPPSSWPRLLLEAYYLHWYHTGKLWSRLSRNRHSLARIS